MSQAAVAAESLQPNTVAAAAAAPDGGGSGLGWNLNCERLNCRRRPAAVASQADLPVAPQRDPA